MRVQPESQDSDIHPKDKLLPKVTLAFFKRTRTTAILWLIIALFGALSYATLLKREGFPSVSIPIVMVGGSYAVDDPAVVDETLAGPISKIALQQDKASSVQTSSQGNFFYAVIMYDESVDPEKAKRDLKQAVTSQANLPAGVKLTYQAPYFGVTGGESDGRVDATVSLYKKNGEQSLEALTAKARDAVTFLNQQDGTQIDSFALQDPYQEVTNPMTGESMQLQRSFDKYGERNGSAKFHQSVTINVAGVDGLDVIELDHELEAMLAKLQDQPEFKGYEAKISASNAPTIEESITELQRVLLEGLLAVLVVGSLIIALRASLITVISMLTIISATIGLLYLLGYSLNIITLFALILGLSLIVDDTIIMVEALDASRKREKEPREVVRQATRKISRAMVAATLTAALSFAPLLFVGGILGTFIRAIPVTIISALIISLFVALIFIPFFAKFLLIGKKQLGENGVKEIAAGIEHTITMAISKPMLWARHSRPKEFFVGLTAVLIGIGFVAAAVFLFTKVTFNIFPPSKDANQLAVALTYAPNTSVAEASEIAQDVSDDVADILGENLQHASYYGLANAQRATLFVNLKPYTEREVTSLQLVDKIKDHFRDYSIAKINSYQVDVGPPAAGFTVNIDAHNREKAEILAADLAGFLKGYTLTRPSGEKAKITEASVDNDGVYVRKDGKEVIGVSAVFDGTDTTILTTLAQAAVKEEFDADKLASYGLGSGVISFDLGQEQENQDSFKSLAIAFPIVLLVIYILLAVQFRSLLQPLLIFMALPFSLFGVALGLYLTDNAFSFFAMLGFFALIGLSIKNTILLTDYANQARRAGMSPIDASVAALGERFRPLIATSLTAIVSLIPLALVSPFWQGLAVVLIFGLASSTLLVITVFPYYYLAAEYLRIKVARLFRRKRTAAV